MAVLASFVNCDPVLTGSLGGEGSSVAASPDGSEREIDRRMTGMITFEMFFLIFTIAIICNWSFPVKISLREDAKRGKIVQKVW